MRCKICDGNIETCNCPKVYQPLKCGGCGKMFTCKRDHISYYDFRLYEMLREMKPFKSRCPSKNSCLCDKCSEEKAFDNNHYCRTVYVRVPKIPLKTRLHKLLRRKRNGSM